MPNYASINDGKWKLEHHSTASYYKLEKFITEDEMHNPLPEPHWSLIGWFEYGELEDLHDLLNIAKLK